MTPTSVLMHIGCALTLFGVSAGVCLLMIRRVRIMDVPNDRSSHGRPTPKSGGIAIVLAFVVGAAIYQATGGGNMVPPNVFRGVLLSAALIAGVSFHDDIAGAPIIVKLTGQVTAIVILMAGGVVLQTLHLPLIGELHLGNAGYALTLLWVLGLTNAYNFMDGVNGLAGGTAVLGSVFLCFWAFSAGDRFGYIVYGSLISGTLGFLCFNFPHGRLFMGDVGSAFLGFLFAPLAVLASEYDQSRSSFFFVPLLFFHFLYDTVFTFFRRLKNRKNVFSAHREHLYQLVNRLGYSHTAVSGYHFALGALQGIGAGLMLSVAENKRILVFLPFLIVQALYSIVIIRKASRAGLL